LQEGFGKSMQRKRRRLGLCPSLTDRIDRPNLSMPQHQPLKYFRFQLFLGLLEITDTTAFLPVLPLHS
jgi:hypothetical protein